MPLPGVPVPAVLAAAAAAQLRVNPTAADSRLLVAAATGFGVSYAQSMSWAAFEVSTYPGRLGRRPFPPRR